MEIKNIIKELNSFEQIKKERDHFQEQLVNLQQQIKSALYDLNKLAGNAPRERKMGKKNEAVVDALYKRLQQGQDITTTDIEHELSEVGRNAYPAVISLIRNALLQKDGIDFRKDGYSIILFYHTAKMGKREVIKPIYTEVKQ